MTSTRLNLAAAFLLLLPLTAFAEEYLAHTPEQLIQEMDAAAKRTDTTAFLSLLTADSRKAINRSLANKAELQTARQEFEGALDDRFGRGEPVPTAAPQDFASVLKRISSFELVNKIAGPDQTAVLRIRTTLNIEGFKTSVSEHTFIAHEENGSWKLEIDANDRINMTAEKSSLKRVADDVRSGRFNDRQSALLALNEARIRASADPRFFEHGAAFGEKPESSANRFPVHSTASGVIVSVTPNKAASPK